MANILLVDDDPLVRDFVHLALLRAGHRIRQAQNGKEAVCRIAEAVPDLVILDLYMPDMDGFETLPHIRPSGCRILAISGGGSRFNCDFLSMAKKLGADDTLEKPFAALDLLAKVDALLGMHS